MEKRINNKLDEYFHSMKTSICGIIKDVVEDDDDKGRLMQFVYDYERLSLTREDFIKRKRLKNAIPLSNRCNAKRASGEQCTRRRKCNSEYCGTHTKGVPHGVVEIYNAQEPNKKVEVYAMEANGIVYYVDNQHNVYDTEDVMKNVENPRRIGSYSQNVVNSDETATGGSATTQPNVFII